MRVSNRRCKLKRMSHQQRAFAHVGRAHQTHVRHRLELHQQRHDVALAASLGRVALRAQLGLVDRRVAAPAAPAARHHRRGASLAQVGKQAQRGAVVASVASAGPHRSFVACRRRLRRCWRRHPASLHGFGVGLRARTPREVVLLLLFFPLAVVAALPRHVCARARGEPRGVAARRGHTQPQQRTHRGAPTRRCPPARARRSPRRACRRGPARPPCSRARRTRWCSRSQGTARRGRRAAPRRRRGRRGRRRGRACCAPARSKSCAAAGDTAAVSARCAAARLRAARA